MIEDGTSTFEWDAENRLTAVKQGTTTLASFAYDARGRRYQKVANGVTHTYVHDGSAVAEERLSSGGTTRHFDGFGIDQHVASQDQAGAAMYYAADHLGSIRQATDTSGAVTLTRDYDPYGNPLAGSSTSGYAFTGREWDSETGLYYYRARHYDPAVGRFTTEDPIGWSGGVNLFAYTDNHPTTGTDPTGLVWGDKDDEQTCFVCAIFSEGRGDTQCQLAIASVILNRLGSLRRRKPEVPTTICDIVSHGFEGVNPDPKGNYKRCTSCSAANPGELEELRSTVETFFGGFNVVTGATFFHTNDANAADWMTRYRLTPVIYSPCSRLVFATGAPW